jgi:hypothetical protein
MCSSNSRRRYFLSLPVIDPIRPLSGKTWRGVFANSTPEKPVVDIARWELALNGQVVRILHSINPHGLYPI